MKEGLKIYKVEFDGVYPVGNCLIIAAFNNEDAEKLAKETITHTDKIEVIEVVIDGVQIIEYLSGDY